MKYDIRRGYSFAVVDKPQKWKVGELKAQSAEDIIAYIKGVSPLS